MSVDANLFRLATVALADVLQNSGPADAKLSAFFRQHRELGNKQRGFVADAVYGVIRRLSLLSFLADGQDARKLVIAWLLRVQGYSVRDLADSLNKQQATWAEEIKAKDTQQLSLEIQADMPLWLWQTMLQQYSTEQALTIARSMHQPAPLDLRVNTIKNSREQVLATFAQQGINAQATPYSPFGIRLQQRVAIQKNPLFLRGDIEVQDEGSQLLSVLLAPKRGEMVADFCAGAGGKSLAIGALMKNSGRIYAFDIAEKRLQNLAARLKRSGLSNLHSQLISSEQDSKLKRLHGKFDKVLVDAPCSGLGTLRRNPDLKWRQQPSDLAELNEKQKAILNSAAKLVKNGGYLLYATCSILQQENQQIVAEFLAQHSEFALVPISSVLQQQQIALPQEDYLQLLPHLHQTDGFFAALLHKQAQAG
jgi:16S rRNA (cytosine967-C5)-methyltransferase